ncbi:MAG: hypothetical protein E6Q92_03785 [Burkholderiaceae bacterium]|nr:MAG: hypothetical protein E6Q92_03785 [Burkholderiaceae bacterium]
MIVVFDTNVWYKQLGLKSASSAAVRFFLKQHHAKVAIPEVVRLEVSHNLARRLLQHIESIRSEYRQLLTAFGKLREVVLPTEPEVHARIEELFASLGADVVEVPFSIDSARASFLKTISKLPPSQNSQQFKDGVVWADCLCLAQTDEVVLVTDDRAFYEDQKAANGLASNLRAEADNCPHEVRVLSSLSELLDAIQTPVLVDPDVLQRAFFAQYGDSVAGTLDRAGFELGKRTEVSFKPFATEQPARLFVQFSMSFACTDLTQEGRTEGSLLLSGDCSFEPATATVQEIRNFGEPLKFRMPDGALAERRNHVLFPDSGVLGHRVVTDITRYALREQ